MVKKSLIATLGLFTGFALGYILVFATPIFSLNRTASTVVPNIFYKPQKIGFLPYWFLGKSKNYYPEINTLTYFGLTIDTDGKIKKLNSLQENEPGWYALISGKVEPFLTQAGQNGQALSLLVFSADDETISRLIGDPARNADNLIRDIAPIMRKYNFTDLNLDIEYTQEASSGARRQFTQFAREVKTEMVRERLGTLTIDVTADAFVKNRLTQPESLSETADYLVVMAYDYHYPGSAVTGPVAPLSGMPTISEFDVQTAVDLARNYLPARKIILGVPLYGYGWETIREATRSATIPGSGRIESARSVERLLTTCATCSAKFSPEDQEGYVVYRDAKTGTYHQLFFPTFQSLAAKINLVKSQGLGGVAVWALGYESSDILGPLKDYH